MSRVFQQIICNDLPDVVFAAWLCFCYKAVFNCSPLWCLTLIQIVSFHTLFIQKLRIFPFLPSEGGLGQWCCVMCMCSHFADAETAQDKLSMSASSSPITEWRQQTAHFLGLLLHPLHLVTPLPLNHPPFVSPWSPTLSLYPPDPLQSN